MERLDEIRITGLRVFGRHGVFESERVQGQDFFIDATLRLPLRSAALSDDVADTVHYGEAASAIAAIVAGEPVALIETLAERIARMLLSQPGVAEVSVTVHKPHAPVDLEVADLSVTIHRAAAG